MAPAPPKNFWGPPTSTLDWCEINYEVSPFIAEFCKSYWAQMALFFKCFARIDNTSEFYFREYIK